MTPMNPSRWTVSPAARQILPIVLALLLMLAPCASARASAQTPTTDADAGNESGVPPRGGLGWTGIALASAGGLLLAGSFTFNDSKGCGFFNELACSDVGRVYGVNGGIMVATGLTFLIIDEVRRHPKAPPKRQTSIAIGPRAIQVRVSF